MPRHPLLTQLLDDELDRAPLLWQEVLAEAQGTLRASAREQLPAERQRHQELQRRLESHAADAAAAFRQSLREEAMRELQRGEPAEPALADVAMVLASFHDLEPALSLVDEDEVAADVAMSRVVEATSSHCEQELRELTALVCALLGDRELARPCNPFRPETYARALWAGARAAGLPLAHGALLLQHLATPLARALRLAYGEACRRLFDAGVEPAAFRTIVLPGGQRTRVQGPDEGPATDLQQLLDTMPAPLEDEPGPASDAPPARPGAGAVAGQRRELMRRLFETIAQDSRLSDDLAGWIGQLQPTAVALAEVDPSLIDDTAHPLWQFVDRLIHDAEVSALAEASPAYARLAQRLVEHVASQPAPAAAGFAWGIERLLAFERHLIGQRCQALRTVCVSLEALESSLDPTSIPPPSDGPAPLDVATLDTVPATLQAADAGPADEAARWVGERRPGDLLRVFLQGRWVAAQWLWTSPHGAYLLLQDALTHDHWALRRQALQRLRSEGLASLGAPPSRVQAAAARLWQLSGAEAG